MDENIANELDRIAQSFIKALDEYIEESNKLCISIISERLGITEDEARQLAEKYSEEMWEDKIEESTKKGYKTSIKRFVD